MNEGNQPILLFARGVKKRKFPPVIMNTKKLLSMLSAGTFSVLMGSQALAGSFASDFSNPNQTGFTLNGGTLADGVTPYPAIQNGYLALTYPENSLQASIVLEDLDAGLPIEAFTATFKLQIGPGSGNPADGLAFCFGPDIMPESKFNEDGTGNGVIVCFDIYDNGAAEAPAIDIKYGGQILATTKFTKADMVTSSFVDVDIRVTRNGTLSLTYKGQKLYDKLLLPAFTPTQGLFAIGGRTGGENGNQWIDDLQITTTLAGNPVMPSITAQPQNKTVNEGTATSFSFSFDGSAPLAFQWYSNNVAIAEAINPSYTIARVPAAANGAKFKCEVSNSAGTATTADAVLTVNTDVTPPKLVTARGSVAFDAVTVTFSDPMDPTTAQMAANYTFSGGLTVSAATLQAVPNDNVVVLTTSKQAEGAKHTLTVSNVKDQPGNLIAANSQTEFRTFVFMAGAILHKKYNTVDDNTGGNPENLFSDPRFPNAPDRTDLEYRWEYPPDGGGRVAADPLRNYFDTLEGYFIPPTTGNFVFLTAGADRWWLYLSTDDSPANAVMIAGEPGGWSDARGWLQMYSGSLENRRSDQSTLSAWATAPTITLTAGKRYYMREVHHDPSWCGADDFSATYKLESEEDPANGTAPRLAGASVGTYVDPTGSVINFTQQPADISQQVSRTAVFTVNATGTSSYGGAVSYQWQTQASGASTWSDIAGATRASYETPALTLADNGSKFRVICNVPGLAETSSVATLTVTLDNVPPKFTGAGAIASQTGSTFDVGVSFDEPVDEASAGTLANYTLSGGTLSAIKFFKGSPGVVLTASGLAVGSTYTITVKNVADKMGNKIISAEKSFKVSAMKWGVVGGDELNLGNGVLPVADNGFDVYSDGIGEWGTYDESTFVYQEVTGNFDKVLRVEYQDASSQWARAGLIVRDVTNFGVDRATQDAGAAGRYQKVHVNPVTTAMGTAGNNSYEANRRLAAGAATTSAGGGGTPQYPNAWCRLQRTNDLFIVYRSDDGLTWTQLGTTTFTESMPAKLYVGPEFSPENGNVDEALRGAFVAKIRDFGDYPYVPPVTGANIAWVSFHPADNDPSADAKTAGFTEAPDIGYTKLLASKGHKVTRFVTSGTPDVAKLNTFDLVIIGRSVPSGDYQDPPETLAWNGITAPTMIMNGYIMRNSRLGYTTGATIPDTAGPVLLSVKNPKHPIFEGLTLDASGLMVNTYANLVSYTNTVQRGLSVNTDPVAGGGTILATVATAGDPAFGGMVIGEWQAGAKMGNAATDTLGGHRLVLLSGSREQVITSQGAGIYDLKEDGTQVFLNAVKYMTQPVVTQPKFVSIAKGADGKITVIWEGGGTLQAAGSINGPWQDVTGATSPYTLTPTANMMFGRIKK
jgi:hypothetical protein